MTVGTGQEQTKDAPQPVRSVEGQPSDLWGPTRTGELVGGKYRISRLLAEGGMGVVYEAQHAIVKRRFAVKFLRPDFVRRRESLGRFQREAEAAGSLESEHIASVVDFGITNDGSPYIVMEYLVGESLACLLGREGRLPLQRAADLCVQACHGAETAHAAGIVHRDLKPHNVFICRRDDGTDLLKILDFGIAKLDLLKDDQLSTQTGTVLGTPAYMSPEQARGDRTIDLKTDIYSLGAILFEMLSGQPPHPGDSRNAVLYHISSQPAVSLAAIAPTLPKALVDQVDRALSASPAARPPSAKAFAADLARFARRQAWPEPPSRAPVPFPASSRSSLEDRAEASAAKPAVPVSESVAQAQGKVATTPVPSPTWRRLAVPLVAVALMTSAGLLSRRWLRTDPVTSPLAPLAASNGLRAASAEQPAQQPEHTDSTLGAAAVAPPGADEALRAPAPRLPAEPEPAAGRPAGGPLPRPTESAVGRGSGRPAERSLGRPTATTSQPEGARPVPMRAAEAAKAATAAFPSAIFDPYNPYASP